MKKVTTTYAATLTAEQREEILKLAKEGINKHEKMKGAYFYTPPLRASDRRSYERYHSIYVKFEYDGKIYEYESDVTCSCRNVYYNGCFAVDGEKKDVRAFKRVVKEIEEANLETSGNVA